MESLANIGMALTLTVILAKLWQKSNQPASKPELPAIIVETNEIGKTPMEEMTNVKQRLEYQASRNAMNGSGSFNASYQSSFP